MQTLVTSANVLSWAAVPLTLVAGWLFIPDHGKGKRAKPVSTSGFGYVPKHAKRTIAA